MGSSNLIRYVGMPMTPQRAEIVGRVINRLPEYTVRSFPSPIEAFKQIEESEHVITLPILVESRINPDYLKSVKDANKPIVCACEAARYTVWRIRNTLQTCTAPIVVVSDGPLDPRETIYFAEVGATDKLDISSPRYIDFFEQLVRNKTSKPKV